MGDVRIEPLRVAEFELVASWLATPAINRWLTADWRGRELNATALAVAARHRRNKFFLARHADEPAALVALSDLDPDDGTAMAWYVLGASHLAGRGVTTEAVRRLVAIAFRELRLRSLYAWAVEENELSQRLLRRVGFRAAGRLRQAASLDGRPTDRLYFDLLAAEWELAPATAISIDKTEVRTPA